MMRIFLAGASGAVGRRLVTLLVRDGHAVTGTTRTPDKLQILQEDLEHIGAEDLHQLQRAWELKHRTIASESVTQHTLFRKETRWPGYYYRGDHLKLDDENWHVLTLSRRDPESGEWEMEKAPVYHIVD